MNAELVAQVCSLPEEERIMLIEELWNSLPEESEHSSTLDLSDAQIEELERRMEEHRTNPSSAISWETAQQQIKERFGF